MHGDVGQFAIVDIDMGSDHARRTALCVPLHGFAASHDPLPSPGLVSESEFQDKRLSLFNVSGHDFFGFFQIVRMQKRLPGGEAVLQFIVLIAEHGGVARTEIDLLGLKIPIP